MTNTEKPIDVSREAILTLHKAAANHIEDNRNTPVEMWWDGYLRALEHVLEMEDQ